MKKILSLIIVLPFAMNCMVNADTYYISPTGNDANPGTESQPFATIMHAQEVAGNGDTIKLLPGVYEN